jgi:hypothetical protein
VLSYTTAPQAFHAVPSWHPATHRLNPAPLSFVSYTPCAFTEVEFMQSVAGERGEAVLETLTSLVRRELASDVRIFEPLFPPQVLYWSDSPRTPTLSTTASHPRGTASVYTP